MCWSPDDNWFSEHYVALAKYCTRRDVAWEKVDPRELLDRQHSGSAGWQQIDAAVNKESPPPPSSGAKGRSASGIDPSVPSDAEQGGPPCRSPSHPSRRHS